MKRTQAMWIRSFFSILAVTLLALTQFGCSGILSGKLFKERAAETPAPDEQAVDKSFFVDSSGKAKTFLCAWAPEIGRGWVGESMTTPFVNDAPHCNAEFEITENFLIARIINPSFLDDRTRWVELLKIPITKHYYFERNKDQLGRETNEWIENTQRSHWSARPKMKINLAAVEIVGVDNLHQSLGMRTSSVEDIEWDYANNFLGFSVNTSMPTGYPEIPEFQARYRINFLKFDHDPSFKKVPYAQENSRYLNILHVMGRRIEGVIPDLYAAHWDVRQTNRIYISGAPKEQQPALIKAVYLWNREILKILPHNPNRQVFVPVIKDLKHPFDLRYPSITWIQDQRISMNAPLGVGMAHADVRNGKILWGGIVLFGGMLQKYISAYAPTEGMGGTTASALSPLQTMASLLPTSFRLIDILDPANSNSRTQTASNFNVDFKGWLNQEMATLAKDSQRNDPSGVAAAMQNAQAQDPTIAKILTDLNIQSNEQRSKVVDFFKRSSTQSLLGTSFAKASPTSADLAIKAGRATLADALKQADLDKRVDQIHKVPTGQNPMFTEEGYTIENLAGSWATSKAQRTRSYNDMLDSVVASLIIHEFGHVVGLGHQFKENIVPEEGKVPSRYVRDLSAKATPEKEFTNFSSVMGYQSGRTEMMTPAEDYVPGPHDDLVLQYLYNSKYVAYDPKTDDWATFDIPDSGKIPDVTDSIDGPLKTSYFPQCNDLDASYGADPFCNRWDRGSKAEDIVNSYFDLLNDNLLSSLYSVVNGGSDSEAAEYRLWDVALDTFSRVRLFYDEMRRRLRSEPQYQRLWDDLRNNKTALFQFSKACTQPDPTHLKDVEPVLTEIFKDPKMVDLCRANALALKEFAFFLNLPQSDYTRIDHNNRYVNGGYLAGDVEANYGHIFGSWYQLSNLPLKFLSLYTLTAANAYLDLGGYFVRDPFYDNVENRFLYRTLYPFEYTQTVANAVESNMRFAATGMDATTTMGRTVLAVGGMLPWERASANDAARLPLEFNDMLDQQTKFNFSMVAVIIDVVKPDVNSNVKPEHYKKFTASIFDYFANTHYTVRDVFLLPDGNVFVWANGMFIFPVTKLKFINGTQSYVIAYRVDYEEGPRDDLVQVSLKRALLAKHNDIASKCVYGFNNHGLTNFFDTDKQEFDGFNIPDGIANETGSEKLGLFYDSLRTQFNNYEAWAKPSIPGSFPIHTMRGICDEAIRGVGQISAAAAMANGYWLGITSDFLEK